MQADSLQAEPQGKPKNTGVGSRCHLQGIFPTQDSNWSLLHCRQSLYQLSYQGSSLLCHSWNQATCCLALYMAGLAGFPLKSYLKSEGYNNTAQSECLKKLSGKAGSIPRMKDKFRTTEFLALNCLARHETRPVVVFGYLASSSMGFPSGSAGKEYACNAGDQRSLPG